MSRKHVSTRRHASLEALEDRLCLSSLPLGATLAQPNAATQAHLSAAYGQLPLSFEVNKGQTDSRVNFLTQGAGYTAFLTHTGAVLELQQGDGGNVVAMKIVGANPASHAVGLDKQPGVSNDFIGNDPSKWHTNIANYTDVAYENAYRGIDLVYHGDQQQLEYDFVVKPGASPGAIRLAFDGARGKSLDAQGNLVLHTSGGDVVEHAPVAYQTINGVRHSVASRFVIGRGGQVGFQVGRYDHSRPLVIDPVMSLSYSTYLGGTQVEYALAIAVDGSGNAYVTGETFSDDFPTANPFQSHNKTRNGTAFVTKFNSTGTALVYSTYLGGSYSDRGTGIAVDGSGDVYVTGTAASSDFPTVNAFQSNMTAGGDAFLAKLSPDGSALLYSTYIGGAGGNLGYGLAVDGSGNAYVTGRTYSASFPTTPGAFQTALHGAQDAFVTKINPSLAGASSLVYSTYLGGSYRDIAYGIAVDGSGNAYVTGETGSIDFPTTAGAFQSANRGNTNAFMTEMNAAGSALVYSTYLGGSRYDYGYGIAVDGSGNAYVVGQTKSTDFPTTAGAFQTTLRGGSYDAFVAKIDPSQAGAASLVYSTYLGGKGNDTAYGIAVDGSGNAYVTGLTTSTNFPTLHPMQATYGGGSGGHGDAFVTKLNPTGSALVYSTYLGGSVGDEGDAIAVDTSGNAFVTGSTSSVNFPTKNAFQPTKGGGSSTYSDVFVTKIAFN
jgi:hypothetical protein